MTQPCHKDTALNQHAVTTNTKTEEVSETQPHTALPHPQQTRQHKTEEERERYERGWTT